MVFSVFSVDGVRIGHVESMSNGLYLALNFGTKMTRVSSCFHTACMYVHGGCV